MTQTQLLDILTILTRLSVGLGGILIIIGTVVSAIKSFILPRGINVLLTRIIFQFTLFFFQLRTRSADYERRDSIMAMFAPMTLFIIPIVMLILVQIGYMALYWAVDPRPLYEVFRLSGSSLLTLGYASIDNPLSKVLEFSEAMLGLILVALLIAYLPTMYGAFSRREANVALLEARAGDPPSAVEFLTRTYRNDYLDNLGEVWIEWQKWFAEMEESHTSLAPLSFFRSPKPSRSWITAAGVVLDTAALTLSSLDIPYEPRAAFCIRGGYTALRHVADFFDIEHPTDPAPYDPISISQAEFVEVFETLKAAGLPMVADREQAWRDFAGWRVNYDTVLLSLATLVMAPYAQWISDRSNLELPNP